MGGCGRCAAFAAEIFDSIRDLRDPEFPAQTLEELEVVLPELIVVRCTATCPIHSSADGCARARAPFTEPWREADCVNCCTRCRSSNGSGHENFDCAAGNSSHGSREEEVEGCDPGCRCCCVVVCVHPTNPRCSFASMLGLLVRARLALDFACGDAAALALNGGAGASDSSAAVAAAAEGGAWGPLPFVAPRLSLWLSVCAHESAESLAKQLNDKERVAAALTTPAIRRVVLNSMQLKEYP
ncbi:transport protein particle component bet3 domain-containing protein [Cyclospora cayetanensis]|nr:transport protein particle component bet3 domain-containing protein [Cyclospora cayetanensis]